MSAKDKNSEVFNCFKKVKGEFRAGSHTTSLNKGLLHTFAFVLMQMSACQKEHMREVIDYVFRALCMVCPGSAVSWNRQDCNRQSMQRVQNTWSVGTNSLFLDSGSKK